MLGEIETQQLQQTVLLDKYTLTGSVLGKGSYGKVLKGERTYLSTNSSTDLEESCQYVAIKSMVKFNIDQEIINSIKGEVQILN